MVVSGRRAAPLLLPPGAVGSMAAVSTVMEHVEERAEQQEHKWQRPEQVCAMLREQENTAIAAKPIHAQPEADRNHGLADSVEDSFMTASSVASSLACNSVHALEPNRSVAQDAGSAPSKHATRGLLYDFSK